MYALVASTMCRDINTHEPIGTVNCRSFLNARIGNQSASSIRRGKNKNPSLICCELNAALSAIRCCQANTPSKIATLRAICLLKNCGVPVYALCRRVDHMDAMPACAQEVQQKPSEESCERLWQLNSVLHACQIVVALGGGGHSS